MSIETKRYLAAKYFPHLRADCALLCIETILASHQR